MKLRSLGLAAAFVTAAGVSQAAVIASKDVSAVQAIPGLTGFATTGAQMDGLRVTATFSHGFTQTLTWADTGAGSGGVVGAGWSLSVTGDTFNGDWKFNMDGAALGRLTGFTLDASGPMQVTLFDTAEPSFGTPNSAAGRDFTIVDGCADCEGLALYSNAVGVLPNDPIGDLFHTLTVSFEEGSGPLSDFVFEQDTDNDSRIDSGFGVVPEPGSLALLAAGLFGVGAARRRTR